MPFSIHTVRWINLIIEQSWEIHFFSSFPYALPHKQFPQVIYHDLFYNVNKNYPHQVTYRDFNDKKILLKSRLNKWIGKGYRFLGLQKDYQTYLNRTILKIQPDIIHSMESQHAGYLVTNFYHEHGFQSDKKPMWIHSTWGLDIDYFQHFPEHHTKLQQMFSNINIYLAEGQRDVDYSKGMGYKREIFIFPSVAGGYDIDKYPSGKIKTSDRKKILVKGEQDSVRRGLIALTALVRCKEIIKDYEVVVYSAAKEVKDYVQYINSKENLGIKIFTGGSYEDWMKLLTEARVSINNNLSDGNPSSLFEAMLMGVFPIQSQSSCAGDWLEDKVTGLLPPAEDPEMIEAAIREALKNDSMVNEAAIINYQKISASLNFNKVQQQAVELYKHALEINREILSQ